MHFFASKARIKWYYMKFICTKQLHKKARGMMEKFCPKILDFSLSS